MLPSQSVMPSPRSSAKTGTSSAGGGCRRSSRRSNVPVPQHPGERALLHDRLLDLGMLELEARGRSRRPIPDEAARQHHRVQRVHADEDPRDRHALSAEPAREAVDQFLERQVAQARIGQPEGQAHRINLEHIAPYAGDRASPSRSCDVASRRKSGSGEPRSQRRPRRLDRAVRARPWRAAGAGPARRRAYGRCCRNSRAARRASR